MEQISEEVASFIAQEMLEADGENISASTPLLELGILDSLSLVSLIAFLETHFGVRVPDDCVTPENFKNLHAIAVLVNKLQFDESYLS
ncbi:MAG: acyl carrier protein [Symploca sp. SIO2D2]|nr:acyl carrier protein [Symploca sp. SIO2D2]